MKTKGTLMAVAIVMIALATSGFTSCSADKQTIGTLTGAGLGGLLGSQFGSGTGQLAMTGLGVLAGAWLGNEVGASLDRVDEMYAQRAMTSALESAPTNAGVGWQNPDSGNSGMVTPTKTYQATTGEYCREYQHSVFVGGEKVKGHGTACRKPDGTWRLVN